jgi:hypothetical protein
MFTDPEEGRVIVTALPAATETGKILLGSVSVSTS